jgi:alpha-ketoglutarate-dependent taurine dioxygenase
MSLAAARTTTDAGTLPLVVEHDADRGAFLAWYREHRDLIAGRLLDHGAVLLPDTGIDGEAAFAAFAAAAAPALLDYVDGNSPRTKLTRGIYTSTEYPAEYFISLHNELSYSHRWPRHLFFCCITAAPQGGETMLADGRELLRRLPREIVEEFTRRRVKYLRNLHGGDGMGPSWQDTFETSDRAAVAAFCNGAEMEHEWRADGGLRVTQTRPAVISHPQTGEAVWFNQADQFHPSTHPEEVREALLAVYGDDPQELPQHVLFGDGGEMDRASLDQIRAATLAIMVPVAWRAGDLLVIDNVLVSHGRMPFQGARRILVSMC